MVASANGDLYSPFLPPGFMLDEPQSSEDGSGLHSPVFGAPFFPSPHGDSSIRYHSDHAYRISEKSASQFNYHPNPPLLRIPQASHLDSKISEFHSPDSHHYHHLNYSPSLPFPPRNHFGLDFPAHSPTITRLSTPPSQAGPAEFVHSTATERRLPGGPSHDQLVSPSSSNAAGMPMDGDHQFSTSPTEQRDSTPSNAANSPRDQRKEISTVVIACRQCRARKIRCDSTRPACNNCVRRSNECEYDQVPKRRGPDKRPGTRQRSCKKRPADGSTLPPPPSKRKRSAPVDQAQSSSKVNMTAIKGSPSQASRALDTEDLRQAARSPTSPRLPDPPAHRTIASQGPLKIDTSFASHRMPFEYDSEGYAKGFSRQGVLKGQRSEIPLSRISIPTSPPPDYDSRAWWDNLVGSYSSTREQSLKDIPADLSSLFETSGYWLSWVNVPLLLRNLYNQEERLRIQPSFILAGLALATLMKSSEVGLRSEGRTRALWLRDAAQSSLDQSLNSQWIDPTLAEAALILALFEMSAHPHYNPERVTTSLVLLDNIISALGITFQDANDPRTSTFTRRSVPVVDVCPPSASKEPLRSPQEQYTDRKCTCIAHSAPASLQGTHLSTSWSYTPPWDPAWTETEVRKEQCRRLCWSALNLVSMHAAQCSAFEKETPNLFLSDPSNFAVMFPGEALDRSSPSYRSSQSPSPKESVWALYCRGMLLWNYCNRLRTDDYTDDEKMELSLEAWVETQSIEDSLDMHNCNLDTALLYMCREYVYNTRIMITQAFRRLVPSHENGSIQKGPVANRKQAEEWLFYQDQVIKRVKNSIHHLDEPQGHILTRRPFQVTWFLSQLAICLSLWNDDHSLLNALELAKSLLIPIDVLNVLWPCQVQRSQSDDLRSRLSDACTMVGIPLPVPADFSLSSQL